MRPALLSALLCLALTGGTACRKKPEPAAKPVAPVSAVPKDVPPAEALHFLNDGVRNYYADKLKMPASLDEVYAAGYLKDRFNPPPGKQFVINPQTRAVELR